MKLPSLFPVACFAGGILLSGMSASYPHWTPRVCILAALILLLCAYVLLRVNWLWTAAALAAGAWICLGSAAATLERASVSPNLASTLIEAGKLDASAPLRWRGRLRSDPLQLPWGTRYELVLDHVESSAGVTPVTGGLRLTFYRDESKPEAPPPVRAGDVVECIARVNTIRNFQNPGNFDFRGYMARQGIELQGTLRNNQLLRVVGHPRLTISDHLARARGHLLNSIDDLFATRPSRPCPRHAAWGSQFCGA
jgi:Domain of unknown function (DUF4131)